jgi:Dual specificity phosphatase, catalytic domain
VAYHFYVLVSRQAQQAQSYPSIIVIKQQATMYFEPEWSDEDEDEIPERHARLNAFMAEVRPGLWIGDMRSIKHLNEVYPKNWTQWTVVSILNDEMLYQAKCRALAKTEYSLIIGHCTVRQEIDWDLPDKPNAEFISPKLDSVCWVLDQNLKNTFRNPSGGKTLDADGFIHPCLVHCAQGVSRSAALIAAYLLYSREARTLEEAMARIRAVRPEAEPNLGFVAGLRALEQCQGNFEAAMVRLGTAPPPAAPGAAE